MLFPGTTWSSPRPSSTPPAAGRSTGSCRPRRLWTSWPNRWWRRPSGEEALGREALLALVRSAWPYHDLAEADLDAVLKMLAEGFATRRGRRGALLHLDQVHGRLRPRRGARLAAVGSGGAIPDTADYDVILEPSGERPRLGERGLRRGEPRRRRLPARRRHPGGSFRSRRAGCGSPTPPASPPNIPFSIGEAPARTPGSSPMRCLGFESEVAAQVIGGGVEAASAWLTGELGLPEAAATQLAEYLAAGMAALGAMPTTGAPGPRALLFRPGRRHAPGPPRAAGQPPGATGPWGSPSASSCASASTSSSRPPPPTTRCSSRSGPPTASRWPTSSATLTRGARWEVLVQALLDAPMFGVRWRWNATRALAVPRRLGGKRMAPQESSGCRPRTSSRWSSQDQLACLENMASGGARSRTASPRWSTRPCATASPRSWTSTVSSSSSGTWPPGS